MAIIGHVAIGLTKDIESLVGAADRLERLPGRGDIRDQVTRPATMSVGTLTSPSRAE